MANCECTAARSIAARNQERLERSTTTVCLGRDGGRPCQPDRHGVVSVGHAHDPGLAVAIPACGEPDAAESIGCTQRNGHAVGACQIVHNIFLRGFDGLRLVSRSIDAPAVGTMCEESHFTIVYLARHVGTRPAGVKKDLLPRSWHPGDSFGTKFPRPVRGRNYQLKLGLEQALFAKRVPRPADKGGRHFQRGIAVCAGDLRHGNTCFEATP